MNLAFVRAVGRPGLALIWWVGTMTGLAFAANENPTPPASPLNNLVRQLAEKRAAPRPGPARGKQELLKPEFRFKPAPNWLLLPDLAKQLTTNEAERDAVFTLLETGVREANRLLAAEGADNEVAAATTFYLTQLWSFVRREEIPEASLDVLHGQIVDVLAGPEMARLTDAEKQRYWEFAIGFPVFVLGMREVATEPAAQADLRTIAAGGFAALLGVRPELVDIGPKGLVISAAAEAEMAKSKAAPGAGSAPAGPAGGVTAIDYAAPVGWQREEAGWATVFRATLGDVQDNGQPDPRGNGHHAGSIFVLPARSMTGDAHAAFDAMWREQFAQFELGDTIVHYRSRLKSGLVVHYMGRFFHRKDDPDNAINSYGVLYLVDLGGGRMQPITAVVVPNSRSIGLDSFKESAAYRALSWPLAALLDTVKPAAGTAPYPRGGYFSPADLHGSWGQSSGAYGGAYVNAATGASAGVAVSSAGGSFRLGADGTYDYSFAYASSHPQFGQTGGSTKHGGRYRLDGDVVLIEPTPPINYKFTCCAVGLGTRQTREGLKRVLVTVSATSDGGFRAPPLVPNWDSYDGTMTWFVEQ